MNEAAMGSRPALSEFRHRRGWPRIRTFPLLTLAGILVVAGLSVFTPDIAAADSSALSATVSGGDLTATIAPTILNARLRHDSGFDTFEGAGASWVFRDARGSGVPWTLTVSGTGSWHSAPESHSADTVCVPTGVLQIRLREITHGSADASGPTMETVSLSGQPQTLIAARAPAMGSFRIAPTFSVRIPIEPRTETSSRSFACVLTYTLG